MSKKRMLMIVPDGVGVRNYLYSQVPKLLAQTCELHIWTTLSEKIIQEVGSRHGIEIHYRRIDLPQEPKLSKIFREASVFARLRRNAQITSNPTIMTNWNMRNISTKIWLGRLISQFLAYLNIAAGNRISSLEQKAKRCWGNTLVEELKADLEQLRPEKVFFTHQRVASLTPFSLAAKELGVSRIVCIYSWDNTCKAGLAIEGEKYLMWSDYMKDEFLKLYPEINDHSCIVTGTPQFEFYLENHLQWNRQEFALEFGLDLNKRWICFSGDDEKTSPYDPHYLKDLCSAVLQLEEDDRPQIIFRRCPVDTSARYDEVIVNFENLVVPINPDWEINNKGNWGQILPKTRDIELQKALANYCDTVINVGSTMALDFATTGKPAMYLRYDQSNSDSWSVKTIYAFEHFKIMQGLEAVVWIDAPEKIVELLQGLLNNPNEVAVDRNKWLQRVVKHPLENGSKRVYEAMVYD